MNRGRGLIVFKSNSKAVLKLLCFPYAGASASVFGSWHRSLPESIEVCAIQLPGRQSRISEPPFTRMSSLIPELGEVVKPHLDKSFAFFGHSMGAILGFELTRWLRRKRLALPKHIFVSGRRAPHVPHTGPQIHAMKNQEFIAEIARLNGTPSSVLLDPILLELVLPALRADVELCEKYEYKSEAQLPIPITAFYGTEDAEETADVVKEWAAQTNAKFSLYAVEGDHFFMHSAEEKLLELVRIQIASHLQSDASESQQVLE